MGEKYEALLVAARTAPTDEIDKMAAKLVDLVTPDPDGGDVFSLADELLRLDQAKSILKYAAEACEEVLGETNAILYDEMLANETQNFSKSGKTFYLTSQTYVQAKPEAGGTANPELIAWLRDNGRGEIAKESVNANSLRAAVNEWRKQNPTTAVVDGDFVEGEELLAALDIDAEELIVRRTEHERLNQLVNFTEKPTVGLRKA